MTAAPAPPPSQRYAQGVAEGQFHTHAHHVYGVKQQHGGAGHMEQDEREVHGLAFADWPDVMPRSLAGQLVSFNASIAWLYALRANALTAAERIA